MLGVLTKLFSSESNEPQLHSNAGGTEAVPQKPEAQRNDTNDGGGSPASGSPVSPPWLSYYAKIAPEEISRWVNPEDGTGSISYQQLVDNLNMFNIPVLPMKSFTNGGNSIASGVDDKSSTNRVNPLKRTQRPVSSGAATGPTYHEARQCVLSSTVGHSCLVDDVLSRRRGGDPAGQTSGGAAGDLSPPAAEGAHGTLAEDISRSESQHSRQFTRSRTHKGATSGATRASWPTETPVATAVQRSPHTADCKSQNTTVDGHALHIPVTATHSTYIGPVREFRGNLSGLTDGGGTRPGPFSQVPPGYVKVLNSDVRLFYDTERHAWGTVQPSPINLPSAAGRGELTGGQGLPDDRALPGYSATPVASPCPEGNNDWAALGAHCMTSARLFNKPPPIFLTPVTKPGTEGRTSNVCTPPMSSKASDTECSSTGDEDAHSGGVTFSLGRYIWTAEDAALGTAHKGEPEMDAKVQKICAGAVFPAVLTPKNTLKDRKLDDVSTLKEKGQASTTESLPVRLEDLGLPSIQEVCSDKIAELHHLSDKILEFVRDDVSAPEAVKEAEADVARNKGGRSGLRAARCAKKASIVFVERAMLKAEMTLDGLWKAFQGLKEDEERRLTMLAGCAADLSDVEAMFCALHCRSVKAGGRVRAFQDFFGKMKLNAYVLRCGEGWALYPHAACIPHSCQPNVTCRIIDGLLVFLALTDIPEGAALAMSYIDQLYMPTEERRKLVGACKRIFCECPRCSDPAQPERTVLCPQCRPTKLCFVDEVSDEEAAANNSGDAAPVRESWSNSRGAGAADTARIHDVSTVDRPGRGTERTTAVDDSSKHAPTHKVIEDLEGAAASPGKHADTGHVDPAHLEGSTDSPDSYSDASPSPASSDPDREEGRSGVCDGLLIVSTTIATKRADADMKKGNDNEDSGTAELDGGRKQRAGSSRDVDDRGLRRRSIVAPSASCKSSDVCDRQTKSASSDVESDHECNSEAMSTSSMEGATCADSNGICSSSDLSDDEPEQRAKDDAVPKMSARRKEAQSVEEDPKSTSVASTEENSDMKTKHGAKNCVFTGQGRWKCCACDRCFTDSDLPVALEAYLTGYYLALRGRLGRPTPETWNTECGQLIRTVEKVLGTEHWLYMAGHLMLAQMYLGMWMGGHVVDVILSQALRHAALVMACASKPAFSAARNADVPPLVTSVLRILLFNGRSHDFVEWVEKKEALQVIRETLGTYDEVYIALSTAYLYVRQKIDAECEPSLGLLHRFAHASQYTVAQDAAYHEKKEAEEKERAARLEAAKAEEAGALARAQRLRQRQIEEVKKNIAALKASLSSKKKPKQVEDVTFAAPDSVVGQYLGKYYGHGRTIAEGAAAAYSGIPQILERDRDQMQTFNTAAVTAKAAYEHAKRVQQLAVEGRYPVGLSPPSGDPDTGYLPLIMLADPLETGAKQLSLVRDSSATVEKEKKRCEELKQLLQDCATNRSSASEDDLTASPKCDEQRGSRQPASCPRIASTNNAEKSFVYRIPGLPGTAPGEFVTISQINHTTDGCYPPIPFFRTFFYVDHDARNGPQRAGENERDALNITVLGCGAEGVAALTKEELEDLAAARYNFLHTEAERFNQEARNNLAFEMDRHAQGAAAVLSSMQSTDAQKRASKGKTSAVYPIDVLQEVNKAVRNIAIQDARSVQCIEKFRASQKKTEDTEDDAEAAREDEVNESFGLQRRGATYEPNPDLRTYALTAEGSIEELARGVVDRATAPHSSGAEGSKCPLRNRGGNRSLPHLPPGVHFKRPTQEGAFEARAPGTAAQNQTMNHDMISRGRARRFLKPLDFSQIPPPPVVPPFGVSPMIAPHLQYKLARAAGRTPCEQFVTPTSNQGACSISIRTSPPAARHQRPLLYNTPKRPNEHWGAHAPA